MQKAKAGSIAPAVALPLALPADACVDERGQQERDDERTEERRVHPRHTNPNGQHKDGNRRESIHHSSRPFRIEYVADDSANELSDAIEKAPFSLALRTALLAEIGALPGNLASALNCSNVTTTDAGNWRVRIGRGRAGELLTAALRALTLAVENESHELRS